MVSSFAVPSMRSNSSGKPNSEYNASMFELNNLALSAVTLFTGKAVATDKYFLGLRSEKIKATIVAENVMDKINFHRFVKTNNKSGIAEYYRSEIKYFFKTVT